MRIVPERRIREFVELTPGSAEAMWRWADTIENGSWCNPAELKRTFSTVSFAREITIFNVGGNKYRIAAFVHYARQILYVKNIGTHKDYDQWKL